MTILDDLIRQGRTEEVWQKYCGFLDLNIKEFMEIQQRLLEEQLQLVGKSELGRVIMGDDPPQNLEEFRRKVPITTYADYAPYLDEKREDVLATKTVAWAHTSGRSGHYKWAPYNATLYARLGEVVITAMVLASARCRGDVRLKPGDAFIYNTPARPYPSGYALQSAAALFDFRWAPPSNVTEKMGFEERIRASFSMALRSGVDYIGSISSVLIKVGESFSERGGGIRFSRKMLHPAGLFRLVRALLRSRLARRPMLPKDLWKVKGLMVGGSDTDIYRDRLRYYWGVEPHEGYGSTEAPNIMACHAWDHKGLYFLPDVDFYEFIPEEEREKERADETYVPKTVLLDEVEIGPRYELVITSFYGAPFLRYRMHDLMRFTSLRNEETGIELPAMTFVSRDAEAARQITAEDDEVDNLYDQVFRELLTFMAEDPRTITRATRLIWVAHDLERSADRVTNICERVVFVVTGKMEEIGASKY